MANQSRGQTEDEGMYSDDEMDMECSYDANEYESIVGWPTLEDLAMWNSEASEFIRSSPGIYEADFQWVGKQPLGQGAFGIVGLWEKIDQEGRVVDKMVIKQVGPRRDGSWNPEVPHEVRVMEEMNKTGTLGVVELRNYRRYTAYRTHRIYMEYCPYGDLGTLFQRYRRFRRYLPEPFLWEVFYYLTEACAAMEHGPPDAPWDHEIVHRDIKPKNVFLGVENPRGNPFYPVAKLGDFGLAVQTSIGDPENPSAIAGWGTRRYMAPEQRWRTHVGEWLLTGTNRYLSSQTNIWAVGIIMYELLTLHYHWSALFAEETDPQGTMEGLPDITTLKIPEYSEALRSLIQECLRPCADHRPRIARLRREIGEYRQQIAEDLDQKRTDKLVPLDEERLYFRGKEIETMTPGNWKPTPGHDRGGWVGLESGFQDPDLAPIEFPPFSAIGDLDFDEYYADPLSDWDEGDGQDGDYGQDRQDGNDADEVMADEETSDEEMSDEEMSDEEMSDESDGRRSHSRTSDGRRGQASIKAARRRQAGRRASGP